MAYREESREAQIRYVVSGSGMDVARPISRILQRSMMAVRFNDQFPNSFDLADPWPRHEKWWRSDGRYRGPSLDSLSSPATWATKVVNIQERGAGRQRSTRLSSRSPRSGCGSRTWTSSSIAAS